MNPNQVIETYVLDVMRRVPAQERNDIGLELRELLREMLEDRAQTETKPADDAMVLAMLRAFGTPAEVAARYRPPGMVIIPAEQTRSFALLAIGGIALQWALTLPRVFDGQPLSAWWLSWGLGSLWWPGFMAMMALITAWLRHSGLSKPVWRPRTTDADRVRRGWSVFGLVWFALGAAFMISLPWIAPLMPDPMSRVFAFDPAFLSQRAWLAIPLWLASFAVELAVVIHGRWTALTRVLDMATSVAFVALLAWWLAAGSMFQAAATNEGAKAAISLVILIILADLAYKLYRGRTRIRPPKVAD